MMRTMHTFKGMTGSADLMKKLTPRELTFLQPACSDKSYQQIADEMSVSLRTVDGYRDALFRRFQVYSRVGMVLYGLRNDIIKL
ncbi:MAG: helix-turn-helix transcriptional regulator [Taibaiella sp.]